jgi:hypothetical protein
MNIILLGYNGLIGSHILESLEKKLTKSYDFKIICVGRNIKNKPFKNRKIRFVKWNFLNFSKSKLSFLKNNFEFMLLAISRCGDIAAYECSQELLLNINFVFKAIKICPDSYMPIAKSENPLSINKDVILLTLNEMRVYEHYRTEYLYDAIYNTIKNEAINDNEINELLIKVKKSM